MNSIDKLVEHVLRAVAESGIIIEEIRSGGQSGVDEAGIHAAQSIGRTCSILCPKGFRFSDSNGEEHIGYKEFAARFQTEPVPACLHPVRYFFRSLRIQMEPYYLLYGIHDDKVFAGKAILSSIVGEITDCLVFLPLAFIGTLPFKTLVSIGIAQIAVKIVFETILLPITTITVMAVQRAEVHS